MQDFWIVGLGNPGEEYKLTRHNAGFLALDEFRDSHCPKKQWNKNRYYEFLNLRLGNKTVRLIKPTTFMNLSGKALMKFSQDGPDLNHLIVVHDDLDLNPGIIRVRLGGGTAGHNGICSIVEQIGSNEFARIRIGIGKPASREFDMREYVLNHPENSESENFYSGVSLAAKAIESLIFKNIVATMNIYNKRNKSLESKNIPDSANNLKADSERGNSSEKDDL